MDFPFTLKECKLLCSKVPGREKTDGTMKGNRADLGKAGTCISP